MSESEPRMTRMKIIMSEELIHEQLSEVIIGSAMGILNTSY
jgi:hypothetical protein